MAPPRVVILMGVAGAGKTTVGSRLAERLGWTFQDADALHPAANVRKMSAGEPLTDRDRAPWLARVNSLVRAAERRDEPTVVACSALKASYRARLLAGTARSRIAWLRVARPELERRLAGRSGHFFDPRLLDSQLATLEEPSEAVAVDGGEPVETVVAALLDRLGLTA